jgi:hypothetical protein
MNVQGVEKPGHEAGHSPPSRAEVKSPFTYTSPIHLHGMVPNETQEKLYFCFTFGYEST